MAPDGLDQVFGCLFGAFEWAVGDVKCRYDSLSVGAILGPGSDWGHVSAVMKALAGRYGNDGVRVVVAFDRPHGCGCVVGPHVVKNRPHRG